MVINNMTLTELYLDYINNFLSMAAFAEHYNLTGREAEIVIEAGRELHQLKVTGCEGNNHEQ